MRGRMHRRCLCPRHLVPADEAQLRHPLQDVVAADPGALGVAEGIAAGRELGNAGQRGHLVQVQFVQLLAIVELRGRAHAVGAVAEESLVEVQLEDLVLAELALHPQRQQHLGELARVAVFRTQEELPGHLLGDGGAAGDAFLVTGEKQPDGAGDAAVVNTVVLIEAGVLDRDERLLEPLRHLVDVHGIAAGLAEYGDQPAVARVHVHRLLQLDVAQRLHIRQLGRDEVIDSAERDHAKQGEAGQGEQRPAQEASKTGGHQAVPHCECRGGGV